MALWNKQTFIIKTCKGETTTGTLARLYLRKPGRDDVIKDPGIIQHVAYTANLIGLVEQDKATGFKKGKTYH